MVAIRGTAVSVSAVRPKTIKRQTLAAQVADDLRQRILFGEIEEGTQLRQEQLAAEFGMSKVPVREALHQLEAEGFVTQHFHRGAVVAGLSPGEIMEIFELRAQIEVWLLSVAMPKARKDDIHKAKALSDQILNATDPNLYPSLNWRFHEALYLPSEKSFVIEHLRKLHAQIERYVKLQFTLALDSKAVTVQHNKLIKLYAAKDTAAMEFLEKHILESAGQLTVRLEKLNEERAARLAVRK